jgi:D-ribose pyranase
MKKTALLNITLSRTIAGLGHGDIVVIGDAGLPVPVGVELIDLAITSGLPDFASVLRVVLSEMQVERHVLAAELFEVAPPALAEIQQLSALGLLGVREQMPHSEFKLLSRQAKVIVRTGECKPFSNIALVAGVTF